MDVYGIKYNCFNKLGIRITINELNHPQSLLVLLRVALYICSQKGLPVEYDERENDNKQREQWLSNPWGGGGTSLLTRARAAG